MRKKNELHKGWTGNIAIWIPIQKPKMFLKAVKYRNKGQCSIPTLSHHDTTVQTNLGKAELLSLPWTANYSASCCSAGGILRTHPPWPLFIASFQLVQRWKWRTRRSRQKSVRQLQDKSMCKQGALHHHLQVYAEAVFTHSNLWQLYYYGRSLLKVSV